MRCPRCQIENVAGARFCEDCGARLEGACPSCGTPVTPGKKFCRSCGAALITEPAGRFASPESYTPKHIAEKILTSKAALEGERKQVTVLFADLKGSMELLADRDPEEARKLLDPVLERMMEAVHRYEGTVNQVMGDGIMALFGAPLTLEDHAVRACYAALRMQQSVTRYAEGVRREHGITIRIRVGLNSGEVVVRAIGSDLHMDYTAVGQTTHLAARMEQLADPGSILLTPDTLTLAEGFVQVTALGPMAVKGLLAPVQVHELAGVSAVRSRLQASAVRGLSRFVGRDAEVAQLHRALEQAGQGRGQIAAIVGEPGVGKSRLTFELIHSHRVEGWLVLESSSVSYGKATSYLPVIDLLKGYFRVSDGETHRDIREKVTGKMLTLDRSLEPLLPALLTLLDVPVEDPQWQALDPSQRRQHTLDALKRLLLREAQIQPLLVVFEDLHWIDSESQAFLNSLVESVPAARLLLLVNYRPEYGHGWGGKTYYAQLRLDMLSLESADELLDALLGPHSSLDPIKALLARRTLGNPLFLEECVRTLVEARTLVGERGAYRLTIPVETIQVPATVQAILAARIDRLPPEEKRLLETAAVIGKDFAFVLLQTITGESEEVLQGRLAHLQTAEFLYETSLFPDLEYTFKHALTHEVTYGTLLHERRRALHAGIVDAIEALHRDRLGGDVDRLAHHAFRGELWGKAVAYGQRAGSLAAERSASSQAGACFDRALEALARLPESRRTLEQAIELRLLRAAPHFALGEREGVLQCMQEAMALAERLGDQLRLAVVVAAWGTALWFAGDNPRALEAGSRAVALAETIRDPVAQIGASLNLGMICGSVGDHHRAVGLLARAVQLLGGDLQRELLGRTLYPSVNARGELARSQGELGDFDSALATIADAHRIAETIQHTTTLRVLRLDACHVLLCRGDFLEAMPQLETSLQDFRASGFSAWSCAAAAMLGYAQVMTGRLGDGIPLLQEAVEEVARGRRTREAVFMSYLSEAQLLAQRPDAAFELAERALTLSRERHERATEARILFLLGRISAQSVDCDEPAGERHFNAALGLAGELGLRPLVAHCHLGLGELSRRTGKRDEAQEHLATATTMYREMDMQFWLEQAEAELKAGT